MSIKGVLLVIIAVALMDRLTLSIYSGCAPTGFHPCRSFMDFRNPEDTGLLWMYALYTPNRCKKLTRANMLLNTPALIVMLLIIGGIESHPGECQAILFALVKIFQLFLKYFCNEFLFAYLL